MIRHLLSSFLVLVPVACSSGADQLSPTPPAGTDAGTEEGGARDAHLTSLPGVSVLAGASVTLPDSDLNALSTQVAGADVVAIGESWHTTGGQHAMRARAVRYLVEHEGARTVLLETPFLTAAPASRYVATGEGTATSAVQSFFAVFASDHMRDLLVWLHDWNVAHPTDPVRFFGFDMQEPAELANALRAFIATAAPARKGELTDALASCFCGSAASSFECQKSGDANQYPRGSGFPPERLITCRAGIDKLSTTLANEGAALATAAGPDGATMLAYAKIEAANLMQASTVNDAGQDFLTQFLARDTAMKNTTLGLAAIHAHGAKTILMAHNSHVERSSNNAWLRSQGLPNQGAMGAMLNRELKTHYRVIGQVSWETAINWSPNPQPATNQKPDSIEKLLHENGAPFLLVDVAHNALFEGTSTFSFDPMGKVTSFIPSNTFDSLLFMDKSEAMVLAK